MLKTLQIMHGFEFFMFCLRDGFQDHFRYPPGTILESILEAKIAKQTGFGGYLFLGLLKKGSKELRVVWSSSKTLQERTKEVLLISI